jgi:hypothetical protein
MKKKIKTSDNSANIPNGNKGTSGINKQHQDMLNNRSIQIAKTKQEKKNG